MSIKDALLRKNVVVVVGEHSFTLRRPSVADLIQASEQMKTDPSTFVAWLVKEHLIENEIPVFLDIDEVMGCDGNMVEALAMEIDKLYGEGRD